MRAPVAPEGTDADDGAAAKTNGMHERSKQRWNDTNGDKKTIRVVKVLPFLEGPVLSLLKQKDQSFWSFLVLLQSHI